MADRRTAIAEAAIRVIDRDGLRGLTHRALDRELGYAQGTTSNYARTRRDLIELVVRRMSERTASDVEPTRPPPRSTAEAVAVLTGILEAVAARGSDARARFALALDLSHDPVLHTLLTDAAPVRAQLLALSGGLLTSLGVQQPQRRASDLVGLLNGLLFDRLAGAGLRGTSVDVADVLTAYLSGLPRVTERD